jgi:1-acyl-sn-glycerol-3-phosphate acyltransferase
VSDPAARPAATSSAPAGAPRARGGTLSDIFTARLADLERRVERELERPLGAGSPAAELALDLAREAWRAGSALAGAATSLAGGRAMLASLLAGRPLDDLGLDAQLGGTVREVLRPIARRWLGFREVRSAALPERGGVLVLLNRSPWPLPVEALVLWAFLCDGRIGDRRMVVLWDDDLPDLPWIGDFLRRTGVLGATAQNAQLLLERGCVVLAFPEGRAAAEKTYDRRYRLARFEARGVIAAALEAGARIVPGAVVGNEESYPLLGLAAGWPVTAQFPLLGAAGLLPLPFAWTLRLGAPVEVAAGAEAAGGADAVADAVRARMQALVGELLAARESLLRG